jgi:hypothetical protein
VILYNPALSPRKGENGATYSKTLEYSSFFTDSICTETRSPPSGKEMRLSIREPLKETLQIDADAIPPKKISCHGEYNGVESMSASSAAEASITDVSSWITYA